MNKRRRCVSEEPSSGARNVKDERDVLQFTIEEAEKRRRILYQIQCKLEESDYFKKLDREARAKSHVKFGVIFVKGITGKTLTLANLVSTHDVELVKMRIEKIDGIKVDLQRLIFAGKQLDNGRTLESYDVQNECTLHLVSRCRGC